MTYRRTIPRDLFNEADLLKCYGRLYMALENVRGHHAKLESYDGGGPFLIEQNGADGSISVANVVLTVAREQVLLYRPLNSRSAWPLWVSTESLLPTPGAVVEDFKVFDVAGNLSNDMLAFIGAER
jgi:hypothetical protein